MPSHNKHLGALSRNARECPSSGTPLGFYRAWSEIMCAHQMEEDSDGSSDQVGFGKEVELGSAGQVQGAGREARSSLPRPLKPQQPGIGICDSSRAVSDWMVHVSGCRGPFECGHCRHRLVLRGQGPSQDRRLVTCPHHDKMPLHSLAHHARQYTDLSTRTHIQSRRFAHGLAPHANADCLV